MQSLLQSAFWLELGSQFLHQDAEFNKEASHSNADSYAQKCFLGHATAPVLQLEGEVVTACFISLSWVLRA